ncbi:MAG: hypothetical protein GX590_02395 [Lentisphaerae bacterium]|nr:hypothetical protein [Lentisphaerota bacterium]
MLLALSTHAANQETIALNPLDFAVREAARVALSQTAPTVLADAATGEALPTQMDLQPGGGAEAITILDLAPGARRRLTFRPGQPIVIQGATNALSAGAPGCRLTNDLIGCTVTLRAAGQARHQGLYQVWLTDFAVEGGAVASGVQTLQNPQLASFEGLPAHRLWRGPLHTRLELAGPAQLWYGTHTNVPGNARLTLTLHAGSPVLDIETRFDPAGGGELYLCSAGQLAVNAGGDIWQLRAPPWKGTDPVTNHFGVTNRNSDVMGTCWVAARGGRQAFSYVHDDLASTIASVPGAGGRPRSKAALRLSNFSAKSNYIRPDFFRVRPVPGEPVILRMRLTLYGQPPETDAFAARDYLRLQTAFTAPRLIAETPPFTGEVALAEADRERIARLLRERDIALVAGEALAPETLAEATRLADTWRVPLLGACDLDTFLNREYSRYDCNDLVLVLVGSPSENRIVYANNTRHALADAYYPGTGKGRIAVIDDFLGTGRSVIYAGGEDARGTRLALRQLGERFAPPRIEAPQFRPMPPALRARPWMRRARGGATDLQSPRRATATAHLLVWLPETLEEVRVETRLRHDTGSVLTGSVAHIAWSYAAIGPGGEVYPEGHEPIHPDGHPLPHAMPFPGTIRAAGAPAPFTSHLANNDALWPGLPAHWPEGRMVSLWVTIDVPATAAPGRYAGAIEVAWRGGRHATPVQLEVESLVLPEGWQMDFNAMYSLHGYNEDMLALYLDLPPHDEAAYLDAVADLGRLLWSHGVTVAQLPSYDLGAVLRPDGSVRLDTRRLDAIIGAYRRGGFDGLFMTSLVPSRWRAIEDLLGRHAAPGETRAPRERLYALLNAWIDARGLKERMIARVGDEPGDIPAWVELARPLKGSGFRLSVCHNRTAEEQMRLMVGTIDVWCPLWNGAITGWRGQLRPADDPACFNRRFFDERRAAGDTIWNYTCATPYASLTRVPTELFFYLWDSFAKGFDGAAYYGGGYWSHQWGGNVLPGVRGHLAHRDYHVFDVFTRSGWSGGTSLFYPDARNRRLLASQRWELLRQAQEDIKLFALYRQQHGETALRQRLSSVIAPRDHDNIAPAEFDAVRRAVRQALAASGK